MAKIKYDVSGAKPGGDFASPTPGLYKAKVVEVTSRDSNAGNPMLEIVLEITEKGDFKGSKMWYYILTDGSQDGRLREFVEAAGMKAKGTLDTDKMEGVEIQIKVKPDKDQYGDYRGAVGKVIKSGASEEEDEEEDDDDEEESGAEEPEEDEDEDEDDDDEVDLDELDRSELKTFIKDNELDVKIKKSMSDDDIRAAIAEASGGEDEDESTDDYDDWNVQELKDECKKRDLKETGKRADLIKRLRADDADDEPF